VFMSEDEVCSNFNVHIFCLLRPLLELQEGLYCRLVCCIPIQGHWRRLDSLRVSILVCIFEIKVCKEKRRNDVTLQPRKSLPRTRMSSQAPSKISQWLFLVLGTFGQISTGIPAQRFRVDLRILMNVPNVVHDITTSRDDTLSNLHGSTGDITTKCSPSHLDADAVLET